MRFGPLPIGRAVGAIAAHSVRLRKGVLRKGTTITAEHVAALEAAGVPEILAARLEAGDVHEDAAAFRLAEAAAGEGIRIDPPYTGRSNLYAERAGVLVVNRAAIDRLNRLDPSITIATLRAFANVEAGRMVATVKIIPFSAPETALAEAERSARAAPPLRVAPFRPLAVGLVATELPSLKPSVMDKTRTILDERLAKAGARIAEERRVAHEAGAVAAALRAEADAGRDLLIAFGASAVVDPLDIIPAGIEAAGGTVRHLGMPVDPGNLLILGEIDGRPVLGAPGCARSPVENGFDWVLDRLLAGLPVNPEDITGMGVGGLLMEIVSRPQPREARPAEGGRRVAAIILAAGMSRRMGGPNKLLARLGDRPLVRVAAEAALASRAGPVTVVTGHMAESVEAALDGLDVRFARNPDFAQGMSTSLRTGIGALDPEVDGAIVLLGDMPAIDSQAIDRLIGAFDPEGGIVVSTAKGRRGNPVIWARRYFDELRGVSGDIGARELIAAHRDAVTEVEIGEAAGLDLDTPEALAASGARLS